MDSWKLREVLFLSLSRWYQVLAFILVGAVIGFGFASLTPAPYQATRDLYLGIDVSRVNEMAYLIPLAEHEPLNIDDYKNWQLKQSADLLRSEQVLGNTLEYLKHSDPIWEEYAVADLRKTIDIYWFEAGTWRLEVVMPEKDLALAAVDAWLDEGSDYLSELLQISQAGYDLDQEIWITNLALGDAKFERAKLARFLTSAEEWTTHLADLGGTDPITGEDYQSISNWVLAYSEVSPFWSKLLENIPSLDQSNEEFRDWLVDKLAGASIAQTEISAQIDILQADKDLILPDYHQYLEDSQGLSSNLVLNPDVSEVQIKQIYSWDSATLGGGILGLLAWVLVVLYKIRSLKVADEE